MKIWQLTERVNPSRLYHWTDMVAAAQIMKTNTLKAGTSHFNNEPGVSFSRVPTATGISDTKPTVLVLDRESLQQNYRLISRYGDIQKAADYAQASGEKYEPVTPRKETEEKVMRDIQPLNRFLTHIVVSQSWFDWMVEGFLVKQKAKRENRRLDYWPEHAITIMEYLVNNPHIGVLVTDNLQAAWTRLLNTESVYPGQFKANDWRRYYDDGQNRMLGRMSVTEDEKQSLHNDDEEHDQYLQKTGFWGRAGAGVLFQALDTGRILFTHRSKHIEQPGTWGTWGGAIDSNENPRQAAAREVEEESGFLTNPSNIIPMYVFKHPSGFQYHNFLVLVDREFKPILNWESQGYQWIEFGDWPQPLHFGAQQLLQHQASVNIMKSNLP